MSPPKKSEKTHSFQCQENPPISKSTPPTAGAILWARSIFHRAKRPILSFKTMPHLSCRLGFFFLEGLVCAEKSQGKSGKKPTIFRPDLAAMPGSSFQKDNKRARPAEGVTQQFGHIWPLCTDKHDLQPTLLGSDLAKFEHFRSTWILAKRF